MTAKIRAIRWLSLTVAVLLLCCVYLTFDKPRVSAGQTESQEEGVYAITDISVDQVAAVMVVNEKMKLGVLADGQKLEAVSAVEGVYSQSELRGLIYGASHLTGSRKLTDSENTQYGLDKPLAEIRIIKTDKTEILLKLLSKSPMGDTHYLYSESDAAVYLIADSVAELFLRDEEDFFSHTVLPVIGSENFQQLDWVEVDTGPDKDGYRVVQSGGVFSLEKPISQRLSALNVLKNLLMPASALYSDTFVEASADLKKYGFEAYTMRIRMSYEGTEYCVLLLDQGGGVCLMADENNGTVYQLGSESLYKLPPDYLKLLDGKAFSYTAGDLISAELETEEDYLFLDVPKIITEVETQDYVLLNTVCSADILAEVAGQPEVLEQLAGKKPEMTITFTAKTGSRDTVRLYAAPEGGFFAVIGDTVNFRITESYMQSISKIMSEGS